MDQVGPWSLGYHLYRNGESVMKVLEYGMGSKHSERLNYVYLTLILPTIVTPFVISWYTHSLVLIF
jgi:hypothetical protein